MATGLDLHASRSARRPSNSSSAISTRTAYLIASDEELLGVAPPAPPESDAAVVENVFKEAAALGISASELTRPNFWNSILPTRSRRIESIEICLRNLTPKSCLRVDFGRRRTTSSRLLRCLKLEPDVTRCSTLPAPSAATAAAGRAANRQRQPAPPRVRRSRPASPSPICTKRSKSYGSSIRPGVACRDLRECLLYQLRYHQQQHELHKNGNGESTTQVLTDAIAIVDQHLRAVQNKQYKEIARATGSSGRSRAAGARLHSHARSASRPALQQDASRA